MERRRVGPRNESATPGFPWRPKTADFPAAAHHQRATHANPDDAESNLSPLPSRQRVLFADRGAPQTTACDPPEEFRTATGRPARPRTIARHPLRWG